MSNANSENESAKKLTYNDYCMGANELEENLDCRGLMEEQRGHQYPIDGLVIEILKFNLEYHYCTINISEQKSGIQVLLKKGQRSGSRDTLSQLRGLNAT